MVNLSVNAQKQFPKFTLHDSGFPSQKHLTSQFYSWIILAYINVTMVHVSGFTSSKDFWYLNGPLDLQYQRLTFGKQKIQVHVLGKCHADQMPVYCETGGIYEVQ